MAERAEPGVEPPRPGRYQRSSTSLEFDRVIFFSDAVFAIAMTLLVVGIGIPKVADAGLDQALRDKRQEILSFFVSFVVIGFYWLSHHQFVSQLRAVDRTFMKLNLLYLAAIAFVPFPTALVGRVRHPPGVDRPLRDHPRRRQRDGGASCSGTRTAPTCSTSSCHDRHFAST